MSIRDHVRQSDGLMSRLRRYPSRGWVAGVCYGLGVYFDWNVKLLRVLFVIGLLVSGFFPVGLIYLVLWYLMDPVEKDVAAAEAPADRHAPSHREERAHYRETYAGPGDVKTRFARMESRLRNMEECVSSKDFELRRELKKLES